MTDARSAVLELGEIYRSTISGADKGIPTSAGPLAISEVRGRGWNVLHEDVSFPAAVLRDDILRRNQRWMESYIAKTGVSLCPHGKTHMAPQLFDIQLRGGAWGITAATGTHVALYRRFGVGRILLANQLLGRQDADFVLGELARDEGFDIFCLVDSPANLEMLLDRIRAVGPPRPLQLLVELGFEGGRTGCRRIEEALELARMIGAEEPRVVLRGIEAFEGILMITDQDSRAKATGLLDSVVELARRCDGEGLFGDGEVLLSAGGSTYFDQVQETFRRAGLSRPTRIVLRSGCYLTHDVGFYAPGYDYVKSVSANVAAMEGDLTPALEIWAHVQSLPEPGLAIAGLGKRDISHDIVPPSIERRFRPGSDAEPRAAVGVGEVAALNDQHAYLRLNPGHGLRVGDLLAFGLSHPCTTFDKWPVLLLVDEHYNVVDVIRTFF